MTRFVSLGSQFPVTFFPHFIFIPVYKWEHSSCKRSLDAAAKPHREGKTGQKFSTWILSLTQGFGCTQSQQAGPCSVAHRSWTKGKWFRIRARPKQAGPHCQHLQASATPTGYPFLCHDCFALGGLRKWLQLARIWAESSQCRFSSADVHLFQWPTGTELLLRWVCKACVERGRKN